MAISQKPLLTDSFLRSVWSDDYERFKDSPDEAIIERRLQNWASRRDLGETASEAPFISTFFVDTWGYRGTGQTDGGDFTYRQQFPINGAGQDGGVGRADLALGWFSGDDRRDVPQVLCEFKGVRGSLDSPQGRAGRAGNRTPVEQARDYLWGSRRGLYGNEDIVPEWAIVTNMREFRLYWFDRMPHEAMVFTLAGDLFDLDRTLLGAGDDARFRRYVFSRVFHAETLLGARGASVLRRLIAQQGLAQKQIERAFYDEYRNLRETLYNALAINNPNFPGTKGRLLRVAQRILDRILFILYCEDRGGLIGFPPQLLRDLLEAESKSHFYDSNSDEIWTRISRLFRTMNEGGNFGPNLVVQRFNGGLFADDAEINNLFVPNFVFCLAGQGRNAASVEAHKNTVLYFAHRYDFSATGAGQGLDLYTLGHIFEQSITELEIREAELDERPSIGKISKRKRDGVYYTPERIVRAIIVETVTPRLEELKAECGWDGGAPPNLADLERYEAALWRLRLVDPACGSGAFLVTALRFFADEHMRVELLRAQLGAQVRVDYATIVMDRLLAECLFGVDINPSSVEITKLALWLHSARRGVPLSSLDRTIRDGNSLISSRFYEVDHLQVYEAEERERVNAFDWQIQFADVFANGGFDFVVGNPPYVKLQNFRQVNADMANYLRVGRGGQSEYRSTQTGNFDLYLPFIEKGISLLNENGRMGYIAPSLWLVNEYGEGLRRDIAATHQLERWIDFKSHQIFEEATTYTALQFFTRRSSDSIRFIDAPDGILAHIDWTDSARAVPYEELRGTENWSLLPRNERIFIERMTRAHPRLDDRAITQNIFVGVQTSADSVYHLKRLGPGMYQHLPNPAERRAGQAPYEVPIEDGIMRPLISGADAKRYIEPDADIHILFPYSADDAGQLLSAQLLAQRFPLAFAYLQSYEVALRARENSQFDDDTWFRFGRHQNLDKQHLPKLLIPRLVEYLGCYLDGAGSYCLDNVDVGGILVSRDLSPAYLAAILNSPISDFIFRRKSKPFRGNYRSANKQFIAHLPIPRPDHPSGNDIATAGRRLQELHTRRRRLMNDAGRRLDALGKENKPLDWIFPGLEVDARNTEVERLTGLLSRRASMDAELIRGELRLNVGGRAFIESVFVTEAESQLALAAWRHACRTFSVTDTTKADAFVRRLRSIPLESNRAAATQFVTILTEIVVLDATIIAAEEAANDLIYSAFGVTAEERAMIEADRAPVFIAG